MIRIYRFFSIFFLFKVKKVHGHGHVLDVLVSDGTLMVGQTIAVCSLSGTAIVSRIKQIQIPQEIQDLRVQKAAYKNERVVHGSTGCRLICVEDVGDCIAGSRIYEIENPRNPDEVEEACVIAFCFML